MKKTNQKFYESLMSGEHKCRNAKEQKKQFRESLSEHIDPSTKITKIPVYGMHKTPDEKVITGYNVAFGNFEKAKIVLTAHYDTSKVSFPDYKSNSIRYCGLKRYLCISSRGMFVTLIIVLTLFIITFVTNNILLLLPLSFFNLLLVIFTLIHLIIRKPNPTNANDNSSGVCLVLHLQQTYPNEVAVILFDCEENGKKGSESMKKEFETNPLYSDKIFINLDTVGCNDIIRIAQDKCEVIDPKTGTQVILPKDDTFEGKQILIDKSYGDNTDFVNLPKGRRIGIETINGDPEKKCTHNLGPIHSAGDTTVNPEMMERVMHLVEKIINKKMA